MADDSVRLATASQTGGDPCRAIRVRPDVGEMAAALADEPAARAQVEALHADTALVAHAGNQGGVAVNAAALEEDGVLLGDLSAVAGALPAQAEVHQLRREARAGDPDLLGELRRSAGVHEAGQRAVLTPEMLERLLTVVNARLRAHATVSRPRITELRKTLTRVDREIANHTRAIGKGEFSSLEQALAAAEVRRTTLQAELTRLDGNQPVVLQLTPGALQRHLEGMTERLRSGVNGKVREAIQQFVARILVGGDGTVTLETKTDGLLGAKAMDVRLDGEEGGGLIQQSFNSASDRRWRVTMAST